MNMQLYCELSDKEFEVLSNMYKYAKDSNYKITSMFKRPYMTIGDQKKYHIGIVAERTIIDDDNFKYTDNVTYTQDCEELK